MKIRVPKLHPRNRPRRPLGRPAISRLAIEPLESRTLLSFAAPVSYATGTNPQAVVTADFNGDGRLDLAVADAAASNVSVLLGNPDGTFQPALHSATGADPLALAVGDLNHDGKLDLVTANSGDVSVLLGNGTGTFQAPASINLGSDPQSVAVGDFNADGKLDLGVTSNVYYPGGTGPYGYGQYPGFYEGRVNVLLGNGAGGFAAPNTTVIPTGFHAGIALADFNADGKLDLATASLDTGTIEILPGNGAGALGPASSFATSFPRALAAADVNGDGQADLITADGFDQVAVLLGTGSGFQTPRVYAVGGNPSSVTVADFNGDGKPDVVTTNTGDNSVGVLLGNGDGSFRGPQSSPAGASPFAAAAGDFNGDGRTDLAVVNSGTGASVLINTGDWRSLQVGGFPLTTTAGDVHSFTVTAENSDGSPLVGYTGTVHFASTDPQAALPADYTFTPADNGSHTFAITLKTAGTQSISVTDTVSAALNGSQSGLGVTPAAAATFRVSGFASPTAAGSSSDFNVTAYDPFGNQATNYAGTVHFSSSDSQAVLPADYTFNPDFDHGSAFFTAALNTAGTQSITVVDTAKAAVTGSQTDIQILPQASITGPVAGLLNQTLGFTLGATGLPVGTLYTFSIDWNGDGVVDQTLSGPNGTTVSHSYASAGPETIDVTATASIGGANYTSFVAGRSVNIFAVSVTIQPDPGNAAQSDLVVAGTADSDFLELSPAAGNAIALAISGYPIGTYTAAGGAPFAHLLVYGYGGSDSIFLENGLAVPALVYGGDGDDFINAAGSVANNVLLGEAGNDSINGGSGRDLVIGGTGADVLRGGGGDDIVIGGSTSYDSNIPALLAIMNEWGRTDASYTTRVKHLQGSQSGGLNGSFRLTSTTVQDDNVIDSLYGEAGTDWFFVGGKGKKQDRVNDKSSGEVVTST